MISRRAILAAPLVAILLAAGCGDSDRPAGLHRRDTEVAKVPEAITAAATKALPGVTFNEAWENLNDQGELHSYELRGRTANGKIREARVSTTGEILEME